MYNSQFWIKYTFRLLHISTVITLGGKIIYDYLFPCVRDPHPVFASVAGVILMIAGFVNIFLLKGKENLKSHNAFWTGTLHLKTLTCNIHMKFSNRYLNSPIEMDRPRYRTLKDCTILLCCTNDHHLTIFEILPRVLDIAEQRQQIIMNNNQIPEHILLSYKIPYSLQDSCLKEYVSYQICMRQNPRIFENQIIHQLPFTGGISNCGRFKETFNKIIENERSSRICEKSMLSRFEEVNNDSFLKNLEEVNQPKHKRVRTLQFPLLTSHSIVSDDNLDPLMNRLKTIIDKHKKEPASTTKLKQILSPQRALQLYGIRRQQIDERFRTIYQNRTLAQSKIIEIKQLSPHDIRVQQFQERIGIRKPLREPPSANRIVSFRRYQ